MSWEIVMGLEVHLQLATQSKIFSGSSTQFGASPNVQADAVDPVSYTHLTLPTILLV